jgi:hypothetical protein
LGIATPSTFGIGGRVNYVTESPTGQGSTVAKIVEVMLHEQWKSKERFNDTAEVVGQVVFWIGTALFEARYRVWPDLFEITPLSLGPVAHRVSVFGTVGYPLSKGGPTTAREVVTKGWVETLITEKLAPSLTACVDGRG